MKGFPDLPPVWLVLFLVLNWGLAALLPGMVITPLMIWLSWFLIILGLVLIGWSALWFWRRKTTIEPHHTPQNLIVEGPYHLSRNPIYLALVVILLGAVIGRGQPFNLTLVPVLLAVLTKRFALIEEAGLRQAFGANADRYIAATRRWI